MNARALAEPNTILRGVVGSTVHGLSVTDQDDRDEMGICVQPWEHFFGLGQRSERWTFGTQPDGVRSGPGDLDVDLQSREKVAALSRRESDDPASDVRSGGATVDRDAAAPGVAITRSVHRQRRHDRAIQRADAGQRRRSANKVRMPKRPVAHRAVRSRHQVLAEADELEARLVALHAPNPFAPPEHEEVGDS